MKHISTLIAAAALLLSISNLQQKNQVITVKPAVPKNTLVIRIHYFTDDKIREKIQQGWVLKTAFYNGSVTIAIFEKY